jgi:hypothetical protein
MGFAALNPSLMQHSRPIRGLKVLRAPLIEFVVTRADEARRCGVGVTNFAVADAVPNSNLTRVSNATSPNSARRCDGSPFPVRNATST